MKKLIFIQLALGLFQIGQAVRNEVELHPEMEKGMDVCGGRVRLERLHNRGTAGGKMEGHMPAIACYGKRTEICRRQDLLSW